MPLVYVLPYNNLPINGRLNYAVIGADYESLFMNKRLVEFITRGFINV
jgi:hypothetical protein